MSSEKTSARQPNFFRTFHYVNCGESVNTFILKIMVKVGFGTCMTNCAENVVMRYKDGSDNIQKNQEEW